MAREQNARKRRNLCEIIRSRKGKQNKHNCFCITNTSKVSAAGLMLNMFRGAGNQKQKAFLTLQPLY